MVAGDLTRSGSHVAQVLLVHRKYHPEKLQVVILVRVARLEAAGSDDFEAGSGDSGAASGLDGAS